ncbi:MAG: ABC transporter permease subunit, partial [Rhodobacteraceae bacterium]|nr:ABC transporter permease subunit [Paracoccaceae bacterium]
RTFVETSQEYYVEQFSKIGARSKFTLTYNWFAGLLGPVWFGARGLWSWALAFLILETIAFVQIVRGSFGDLSAEAWLRIASIENTLELRRKQLASAIEKGTEKIDVYRRAVESLENNIEGIKEEALALDEQGNLRLGAIGYVERFFEYCVLNGEAFFDAITRFIRMILDALETIFVGTPWIVVASLLILLTHLSAGPRMAIYTAAFLSYMGLLGFWEKAMTTLALLGTAACLSIIIGIPLGMFCARRQRLYSVIQPIMDFMQTMPAFVFMIPVIAFFGTGKPAAVVTTMIFGGTPVVRLTVLGLRGVPESVREAAASFGASKWYLLTKVDLPLAAPSIRAGVNQTIMLSLAMVVVASLIGAKGLGEDVLEALQYANVGQGILAGFCILFCAMILDRIVQGGRR